MGRADRLHQQRTKVAMNLEDGIPLSFRLSTLCESVLGGDASLTDSIVVSGNTSGSTNVQVINLGGTGAQTVEGIRIVQVDGTSAGSFSLLGDYVFHGDQAVVGGAYAYRLYQGGSPA